MVPMTPRSWLDFDGLDGVLTSRVEAAPAASPPRPVPIADATDAPTVIAAPVLVAPPAEAPPSRAWLGFSAGVVLAVAAAGLVAVALVAVAAVAVAARGGLPAEPPIAAVAPAVAPLAAVEPVAAPVVVEVARVAVAPEPAAPWVVRFGFDAAAPLDTQVPVELVACASVSIVGHTDAVGAADVNEGVGLQRAEAVRALLLGAGLSSDRLTVASAGESEPIESNATPSGRRANRRVQVTCNH